MSLGASRVTRSDVFAFANLLAIGALIFWCGAFYGRVTSLETAHGELKARYEAFVERATQTYVTRQILEDWLKSIDKRLEHIERGVALR